MQKRLKFIWKRRGKTFYAITPNKRVAFVVPEDGDIIDLTATKATEATYGINNNLKPNSKWASESVLEAAKSAGLDLPERTRFKTRRK